MKNLLLVSAFFLSLLITSCTIESTTHFNKDDSGNVSMTFDMGGVMNMMSGMMDESDSEGNPMDSLFLMFSGEYDGPEADSMNIMLDSIKNVMAEAGMKNFQFNRDGDYGLNMTYDFDDLTVFDGEEMMNKLSSAFDMNQADMAQGMFGDSQSSFMNGPTVSRKGKWMIIDHSGGMTWDQFMDVMKEEASMDDENEWVEEDDDEMMNEEESMEMAMGMLDMMGGMFNYKTSYSFDRKIKEVETSLPHTIDGNTITLTYTMAELFEMWEEGEDLELRVKLK